ncbi:MAG: pentapeptide repeat-containing protein, partial [Desulfobacterales bacterium]|nr:pentapeptide repeat-containing protein [Desulfobacterales bacterium]
MNAQSKPFDLKNFENLWKSLDTEARIELVSKASDANPNLGILPIIKGLLSHHYNIRNAARKSLETLQERIGRVLDKPGEQDAHVRGLKQAALVSDRLYQHMQPEMPFNDISFFLKSLLGLGDHGAYCVFKALFRGVVSESNLRKFIHTMPESRQLAFVDQYLMSTPEIRLKYVGLFRPILTQLTDREAVVGFYSNLFDQGRDSDPFLGNIPEGLRNSDDILKTEMVSLSPGLRIKGLKALAMIREKIPHRLLLEILEHEEVKKVRTAVYQIIANSSLGHYPELYETILERLENTSDNQEGLDAFKALVVTGAMPVYKLLNRVKEKSPEILPSIHMEVGKLSRLGFFIIQDIAAHREEYEGDHFDVNMACVLGMIQNRPERVVRAMKKYNAESRKSLKMDVDGFVKKTRRLFSKERQSIEAQLETMKMKIEKAIPQEQGILASIFNAGDQKDVESITGRQASIDFQDQYVVERDFTTLGMAARAYYFNGTIFKDCKLSGLRFDNAWFSHCVFYNVDFSEVEFDGVCFDRAVFMNVQAPKATFKNCSFHDAQIYNSNFLGADFSDAALMNARISKTVFTDADLTCASFSHALLSGVSFVTANLNQTDFSHVKARFCQFPAYFEQQARSRGFDPNARRYRLGFTDLPVIDKSIVASINLMLFSEFIGFGEKQFLNQNKMSTLMAFDVFKPKQAALFLAIPLMLHENIQIPGESLVNGATPCGIAHYMPSDQVAR